MAGWKWAVLFSRQILNGSQDIFFSLILQFSFCFFKYETTIETHARAFFTLNILAVGRVKLCCHKDFFIYILKYGFCNKSFRKDETLASWTQVEHFFNIKTVSKRMSLYKWPLHSCSIYYWLGTDLFSARNLQKYSISQNVILMTDSNFPSNDNLASKNSIFSIFSLFSGQYFVTLRIHYTAI